MKHRLELGVNVDHVATVRQARLSINPDPVEAARWCEEAGADGITAHLREDRRHIQDADMIALVKTVRALNMEMAVTDEMVRIASTLIKPANCCLVPEKRQELTTEGGLNADGILPHLKKVVPLLQSAGTKVSLFIDPEQKQIDAAKACGANYVELHTGAFANASGSRQMEELERLIHSADYAHSLGIGVNAGHGIDYQNIQMVKEIPFLHELNIGHSIIARSIFIGIKNAVTEMIDRMADYNKF